MLIHTQDDVAAARAAETAILCNESLSNAARGLLLRILRHAPEWDINAQGLSAIAREARGGKGESVAYIRSCFKEMERAGYLVRAYVRTGRRGYGTQLNFHDTPQPVDSKPVDPSPTHSTERGASVVYVIGEPGSSKVKIGQTSNLRSRMADYRTHSPIKLDVLWTSVGGFVLEQLLHQHFSELRAHGEWFEFGEADPVASIAAFADSLDTETFKAEERRLLRNGLMESEASFEWTPHSVSA